ncbi:hypothetical protein ILYODFUR_038208, partial [Ilyodon furcidens]
GEVRDVPRFSLFYTSFGLEVIALILSALADIHPEAKEFVKKNPEAGAAFLSRITFNWINRQQYQKVQIRTRTRRLPLYPGPGCGGSRLSRDAQMFLSPDTSSSSSGGSPRRSQASRET